MSWKSAISYRMGDVDRDCCREWERWGEGANGEDDILLVRLMGLMIELALAL